VRITLTPAPNTLATVHNQIYIEYILVTNTNYNKKCELHSDSFSEIE